MHVCLSYNVDKVSEGVAAVEAEAENTPTARVPVHPTGVAQEFTNVGTLMVRISRKEGLSLIHI